MVILVAAEAIVPFDFIKTNKKHLRNKTKHKRNKNIFWVISRNDCKKKKKKNGDNNGHGTCCKVIVPWLEVHLSVL